LQYAVTQIEVSSAADFVQTMTTVSFSVLHSARCLLVCLFVTLSLASVVQCQR